MILSLFLYLSSIRIEPRNKKISTSATADSMLITRKTDCVGTTTTTTTTVPDNNEEEEEEAYSPTV